MNTKKFQIGIIVFVILMSAAIVILCYQIPGTDKVALWCILLPMVALRLWRCLLLIRLNK